MNILPEVLRALSPVVQNNAQSRLTQVHNELCRAIGAVEVKLLKEGESDFHGITQLSNAAREARYLMLTFELPENALPAASSDTAPQVPESQAPDRVNSGVAGPAETTPVILALHRLQHEGRFLWAGFVVGDLLPQLGYSPGEAKDLFNQLDTDGVIRLTKVPNPKRPQFPTTRVHLNYEHPRVKAVLQNGPAVPAPQRPLIQLPPGAEPVSETIIRERR